MNVSLKKILNDIITCLVYLPCFHKFKLVNKADRNKWCKQHGAQPAKCWVGELSQHDYNHFLWHHDHAVPFQHISQQLQKKNVFEEEQKGSLFYFHSPTHGPRQTTTSKCFSKDYGQCRRPEARELSFCSTFCATNKQKNYLLGLLLLSFFWHYCSPVQFQCFVVLLSVAQLIAVLKVNNITKAYNEDTYA